MSVLYQNADESVSPVIGTILMVSITVILAALVATMVFGMSTHIPTTRTIAVTVDGPDADNIIVVYKGGPDASSFSFATVNITSPGNTISYSNKTNSGSNILGNDVGSMVTGHSVVSHGFSQKDHVLVVGHFKDGSQQVILDVYI